MRSAEHLELLAQGALLEAERRLLAALERAPAATELHLDAVRLYHALNEPERAATHLGRAREIGGSPGPLRLAEAIDHLANQDPAAAAELLAPLTRDDAPAAPALLRIEAYLVAAEAEAALGHAFRALRYADRAAALAGPESRPDLLARALLLAATLHQAKGNRERAEEEARRARELAERGSFRELVAEVEAFLGAHDLGRARPGERGRDLRERAAGHFAASRAILRELAAALPEPRRASFLAHPRRARLLERAGAGEVPGEVPGEEAPVRAAAAAEPRPSAEPSPRAPGAAVSPSRLVATLSEITTLINSMRDLDALLERVMDVALEIVGAERGLVILFEPAADKTEKMEVKVARNLEGALIEGMEEFSRTVVREAAAGREVVTIDTASDPFLSLNRSVTLYSIRSLVCFPLRIQDAVLGAVYLDNQRQVKVYRPEDLDFLRAFTNLAAIAIENSRLLGRLREENLYLKRVATERFRSTNIIGSGPAMERVFKLVEKAMDSGFPVLVYGETGTGKEVVTKAIHFGSARKDKPFVAQNCAAIPSELLESEMFGYKRGAFTGADQDKKGLFEIASGGTLFLDEIGELDQALQAKLLRVLQDGTIRRVGETSERKVDVRIIAATNRNLKDAVERGSFRLDLYYRLNVLQIDLPPLRDRREDIPLLAQVFLDKSSKQMGKPIRGFTNRAIELLVGYGWPGNVRELENAVARAVVFADRDVIDIDHLPSFVSEGAPERPGAAAARPSPPPVPVGAEGSSLARARDLLARVETGGESFWEAVKRPFLKRDLSREVVRELLRLGLEKSGWKYTRALRTFNLPEDDYRRFMNFLAKYDLKVERPLEG